MFFDIVKDKTWYTINSIYKNPTERLDGRKENRGGNNSRDYPQYLVDRQYNKNTGIYSIILFNDIYIVSTTNSFRLRF